MMSMTLLKPKIDMSAGTWRMRIVKEGKNTKEKSVKD